MQQTFAQQILKPTFRGIGQQHKGGVAIEDKHQLTVQYFLKN